MKKTFHIISLGCAKNTVDADDMAQLLIAAGYKPLIDRNRAQVLIVNTCGFIAPAREESYETLATMVKTKRPGQRLVAAGCLTQRYGEEIFTRVNGVDAIIGTRQWPRIVEVVENLLFESPLALDIPAVDTGTRAVSINGNSAYLKIADGCRRPCAFCAIPLIKGTTVSREPEIVIDDARFLQSQGIQEINLIAQDTTDYGTDLGIKDGLAQLLEKLLPEIPRVPWIRILYSYPGYITDRLISIMSSSSRILPYLDMPLQHAHPEILKSMRRPTDIDWVYNILAKMRRLIPALALRTTFIVGYPGESERHFQSLLDFVSEIKFDKLGVFAYSFEKGTAAATLGDTVPEPVKEERRQRLMTLQQSISLARNREFIGKQLDVLLEGTGQGISIGRSYRDAPEVDGLVVVKGEYHPGQIIPVKITEAMDYDLGGIIVQK